MKLLVIALFLLNIQSFAQQKFITKTGQVNFEASVASFEEVSAKNNSVTAILDTKNGEFAALALVKAFRFKNALMEEHFNENYAESHQFPKATFKGHIDGFSLEALSSSKTTFTIRGELTFHGVTKTMDAVTVVISKTENGGLLMAGNFKVLASDFNIEIPKIVRNKIAEDIAVEFEFVFVD